MHAGYNLVQPFKLDVPDETLKRWESVGEQIYADHKLKVVKDLNTFIDGKNINGTNVIKNWFPMINAHVFISHAHADAKMAKQLAGWLKEKCKLDSFIDSCAWGNIGDMIRRVDEELHAGKEKYDYETRNRSNSHVHMMLATALAKMIAKTECLIFLNTPLSVTPKDSIRSTTMSPWIYAEIVMATSFPKTPGRKVTKSLVEGRAIEYELDFTGLYKLTMDKLKALGGTGKSGLEALDQLYQLTGVT